MAKTKTDQFTENFLQIFFSILIQWFVVALDIVITISYINLWHLLTKQETKKIIYNH